MKFKKIIDFIQQIYNERPIPLHRPLFNELEKFYLNKCIDSTFVSSTGEYIDEFEREIARFCGVKHAISCVNGTAALHASLHVLGVNEGDEVLTQTLSFISTSNSIIYTKASPIFMDVDRNNLSLCPIKLENYLIKNTKIINNKCINKNTNKHIKVCIIMHTFGHIGEIIKIKEICDKFHIYLLEDCAESLGSFYNNIHSGNFGIMGTLSFNGNKIITTGGGGAIITNNDMLAKQLKHICTTAKVPHNYEYNHDEIGFNYRLPNINAALGCAQIKKLDYFLNEKRELADKYQDFFNSIDVKFITENINTKSNYWLNAISFNNKKDRDEFLEISNNSGVHCRGIWKLNNELDMYKHYESDNIEHAKFLEERIVNIPSSVISLPQTN